MVGGPSQVDTFDYKPELQRLSGQPLACVTSRKRCKNRSSPTSRMAAKTSCSRSPYAWQQYGESGMWVSELFPHIAQHVDDLCFIHSMQADSNNHAPASYQLHTGDIRVGKASLGSWTTYGLGSENQDLPGYVVLFDAGPLGGAANYSNGFLAGRVSADALARQGHAGPRSAAARRICRRPAGVAGFDSRAESAASRIARGVHRARCPAGELRARVSNAVERAGSRQSGAGNAVHAAKLRTRAQGRTHTQLRPQVPARAAARGKRRAIRAALRHARQRRLGRARASFRTTTRRWPAGPTSRSRRCSAI